MSLTWRYALCGKNAAWAVACFGAFAMSLLQMARVSRFLYFQF